MDISQSVDPSADIHAFVFHSAGRLVGQSGDNKIYMVINQSALPSVCRHRFTFRPSVRSFLTVDTS